MNHSLGSRSAKPGQNQLNPSRLWTDLKTLENEAHKNNLVVKAHMKVVLYEHSYLKVAIYMCICITMH